MLLRLLPIALLALALFAVPNASAGTCGGLGSGGDTCIGAYDNCDLAQDCPADSLYLCVGVYANGACTGLQKP